MKEYKWDYRVISIEEKEQLNHLLAIGYKEDDHNDYYIIVKQLICIENDPDKIPQDTFYNCPVSIGSVTSNHCYATIWIPYSLSCPERDHVTKDFSQYLQQLYNVDPRITIKYFSTL